MCVRVGRMTANADARRHAQNRTGNVHPNLQPAESRVVVDEDVTLVIRCGHSMR